MLELAGLLAKYKNLKNQRQQTLLDIQTFVKECCGVVVPTTTILIDERKGDVRINVSGPKRVKIAAARDELAKRISERFKENYRVR